MIRRPALSKRLFARPPEDATAAHQVRRFARRRHAPADWIQRARRLARRWDGVRTTAMAAERGCHPQTVRERLVRCNAAGLDGLGDRPGAGRKRRITEAARRVVLARVATVPPGTPVRQRDGALAAHAQREPAQWTLAARTAAAQERGSTISRSQVRRILTAAGVRWRQTHAWAERADPAVAPHPTREAVGSCSTDPPGGATPRCLDARGPVRPRTDPPAPGWSVAGQRSNAPREDRRGPAKVWVDGAVRVRDGQVVTLPACARTTAGELQVLAAGATANPTGDL
jgi:transposase